MDLLSDMIPGNRDEELREGVDSREDSARAIDQIRREDAMSNNERSM